MTTALEAIDLSKDFKLSGGQVLHAVADVSLRLDRGAVVALVGESGSGKSTVARLLAGQDRPTSGEVRLDGQPIDVATRAAFRRYKSEVQLVFQDPFASLNPIHTVRHHLERPVRLHWQTPAARSPGGRPETALRRQTAALHGRPGSKAEVGKEVDELLEQVRLTPAGQFASKYPHELSGGQRQRVSFARALAARPTVLLADEPVSMLDVSIRLEMLRLLDDLRQRLRLAMLYITHDIASARYFSDEILVMYAGQIVERGPAEELTQQPAHPYTQLLVASAPDPDNLGSLLRGGAPVSRRVPETAGQAPSGQAPSGCPFSSRCPFADDHCRQENPPLQPVSASRSAACWRLDVAAPDVISNQ